MYDGKNKKAILSQKMISESFTELLRQKPMSEISITDIAKKAGVSRQTFYSVFGTKENIIHFVLENRCGFDLEKGCNEETISINKFADFCAEYIIEKESIISALANNGLISYLKETFYENFYNCSCFFRNIKPPIRKYVANYIASGLTGIAEIYVSVENKPNAEDLKKIIHGLLTSEIYRKTI